MQSARAVFAVVLAILTAAPSFALQKGQPAPPFEITAVTGEALSLAALRGKVVVLDFFATWCAPCREAAPRLQELAAKFRKQGLQVIGLSMDDDAADVRRFSAELKIRYPLAVVPEKVSSSYGILTIPNLFVIDRNGAIVGKFSGYSTDTEAAMEKLVRKTVTGR